MNISILNQCTYYLLAMGIYKGSQILHQTQNSNQPAAGLKIKFKNKIHT